MGKIKTANRKKMVRINPAMGNEILKMREMGMSLRKIGRAMGLTHPGILYYLRKVERTKTAETKK